MNTPVTTFPFNNAKELVDSASEINSCPKVFAALMECFDDPDATFDHMGTIVQSDPGLTAKILKVVNSPFYHQTESIADVEHAIQVIGVNDLTTLVLATSVISHFRNIPENLVTLESFWTHSISTAVGAVCIAEKLEHRQKSMLYTGGIIHDIGGLLIYSQVPDFARMALERCNEWGKPLETAESAVMGFSHTDVGLALAQNWKLPEILQVLLSKHHKPGYDGPFAKEVSILRLADYMALSLQLGSSGEHMSEDALPESLDTLNMGKQDIQDLSAEILSSYREALEILNPVE